MNRLQRTSRTTARAVTKRTAFTLVEMLVAVTIGSLLLASVVRCDASPRQVPRIGGPASHARILGPAGDGGDRRGPAKRSLRSDLEGPAGARCGRGRRPAWRSDRSAGHQRPAMPPGCNGVGSVRTELLPGAAGGTAPAQPDVPQGPRIRRLPERWGLVGVVADGIVELSFEYLSDERWQTHWSELERRLPDAVRVTVGAAVSADGEMIGQLDVTYLSTVVVVGINRPAMVTPAPEGGEKGRRGRAAPMMRLRRRQAAALILVLWGITVLAMLGRRLDLLRSAGSRCVESSPLPNRGSRDRPGRCRANDCRPDG